MPIYFDHAASTPILPQVKVAYDEASEFAWANPAATHRYGQKTRSYLEKARVNISELLNCQPSEIIFTSSATESNNLAIVGTSKLHQSTHIIVSSIDHASVREITCANSNLEVDYLPIDENGFVRVDLLDSLIKPNTRLISIAIANNEIGVIQDIVKIGLLLKNINEQRVKAGFEPIYFHSDAVQAPVNQHLDLSQLPVDFLTLSSSKVYSPKGAAILFKRHNTPLSPIFFGGKQEHGLRSSTPNVPAIWAFSAALEFIMTSQKFSDKMLSLRDYLIEQVSQEIPYSKVNGFWHKNDMTKRLANNAHFSFRHIDTDALLTYLDLKAIYASSGSSCLSGSNTASHVMQALKIDPHWANLRISLGLSNTKDEIDILVNTLKSTLK